MPGLAVLTTATDPGERDDPAALEPGQMFGTNVGDMTVTPYAP
jgi:hypothetical protein